MCLVTTLARACTIQSSSMRKCAAGARLAAFDILLIRFTLSARRTFAVDAHQHETARSRGAVPPGRGSCQRTACAVTYKMQWCSFKGWGSSWRKLSARHCKRRSERVNRWINGCCRAHRRRAAPGRLPEAANGRFVAAKREEPWLRRRAALKNLEGRLRVERDPT